MQSDDRLAVDNLLHLASLKHGAVGIFEWFGEFGYFFARLIRRGFLPPYEGGELIRQMDEIGSKSLPLVALA
ncbi:MAG: hypothetical protein C5B54_01280, partial [Acidobacteria bacterium]